MCIRDSGKGADAVERKNTTTNLTLGERQISHIVLIVGIGEGVDGDVYKRQTNDVLPVPA